MKKYKIGMYGGKFMPFHKGHKYCLEKACSECETVYAILFYNGCDEINILKKYHSKYLSIEERIKQLNKVCEELKDKANIIPAFIDCKDCRYEDGTEDWDKETPLVRNLLGNKLDAVYSSEISYEDYFKRAYPEAKHRLVDPPRKKYPISGTKIRKLRKKEEKEQWII